MTWKWLWRENNPLINQRYIRIGPGIKIGIDKILHPEIGPLVEEEIKGITTIETIIGQIIETDQEAGRTTIDQVTEVITIQTIIDEVIWDQIRDKMPNGLLGTEVRVEIEMMTILEVEVETETIVDLSEGEEKSLGPNLTPGLVLIAIELGLIDVENMIITHLNVLMLQLMMTLTMKM